MAGLVAADAEWVRGPNSFDSIYCLLTGCNITGNLDIQGNLTVTGDYVNVTVVDYNVTGSMTVDGGVVADNFSGVLFWTDLSAYPSACSAGQFVSAVADTLTCSAPPDNDTNTHVIGNPPYLSNDSTTMYFNETKLNETIDAREVDTNTHVIGNPPYLSNDSTTMYFNETKLNETIDAREVDTNTHVAGVAPWLFNDSTTMTFNETHFNDSVPGLNYWTQSGTNLSYDGGNVGIGDSTPDSILDVQADIGDNSVIIIDSPTGSYDSSLEFRNAGALAWQICMDDSVPGDELDFIRSGSNCGTTDLMSLTSDGLEMGQGRLYFDRSNVIGLASFSSRNNNQFTVTSTGQTYVTISHAVLGQPIWIVCGSSSDAIFEDQGTLGNLQLAGDFQCNSVGDSLHLIWNDNVQNWIEISRSDN